jgi:hypothetical protein
MQSLLDLYLLVDKYAAALPNLNLDGDEQEEYSTMLLWLQNQVEGGTPNQTFVDHCLEWLQRSGRIASSKCISKRAEPGDSGLLCCLMGKSAR